MNVTFIPFSCRRFGHRMRLETPGDGRGIAGAAVCVRNGCRYRQPAIEWPLDDLIREGAPPPFPSNATRPRPASRRFIVTQFVLVVVGLAVELAGIVVHGLAPSLYPLPTLVATLGFSCLAWAAIRDWKDYRRRMAE